MYCIARIRGKSNLGEQCPKRKFKITDLGNLCEDHYLEYMNCIKNKCKRGINGWGACNTKHKGLWLGIMTKSRPVVNSSKKHVIFWADFLEYKKKYCINSNMRSRNIRSTKPSPLIILQVLRNIMNSIDLEDDTNTPSHIISLVEKKLDYNFKLKGKQVLFNEIHKIYRLKIEDELMDETYDKKIYPECLDKIVISNEEYYLDPETYEVFTYTKKPKFVGIYLVNGTIQDKDE